MGTTTSFDNSSPRLKIIGKSTFINEILIKNDPIQKLIKSYDIIHFENIDKELIKFIYYNMDKIHEILYEKEKIIMINCSLAQNFESNYYLILLIKAEPYLINYEFTINYIQLFNKLKKNEKDKYFNLIISKIIIDY